MTARRWLPWAVLGVVVAGTLVVGAGGGGPSGPEDRVQDVAASVRCPTCRGQSVLESDSSAAKAMRAEIERRVEAGESNDEIRDYFASRYGRAILLTPPASGVAALVWVLPVAGIVAAAAGLAVAFRRWRVDAGPEVGDEERMLVERARRRRMAGGEL